jgi:NTE family protein
MTTELVLGGGGPVGVAWEVGVLAGLAEAGVDLSTADQIIGTSAGSIVGARLALGQTPSELAARGPIGVDATGEGMPKVDPGSLAPIGALLFEAMTGARPVTDVVGDLGTLATSTEPVVDEEGFIRLVGDASLGEAWPDRSYRCTAWNIDTREFTVWGADSGVPLGRAVATSCSVPGVFPPITIDGQRYMDGGVITASNAQLAEGADTVVVISVTSRIVPDFRDQLAISLDREIAELRAQGATVELIEFDDATAQATAGDLMSTASSAAVAETAVLQGRAEADRIGAVWG